MSREAGKALDLENDVFGALRGESSQRGADNTLEHDIFGAGSDLSSDDDAQERYQKPKQPKKPRKQAPAQEESDSGLDEDYIRAAPSPAKKRKPRATEDGDAPKRKKKKKEKSNSPVPDIPLTAEELRKKKLDESIKDILKPAKRAKKRSKKNEDDLDQIADRYVADLRAEMIEAAESDKKAHQDGIPALAKLRMLDQVMDTLQKRQYSTAVMDQDLLGACKIWLEPLDSKSLPALNIQTAFFEHFEKMNIDTETLRESGLGRIVLFYTKCSRVIPRIARIASTLVDTWTRPILKRSASYFDKVVPVASADDMESLRVPAPKLAAILQDLRLQENRATENGEEGPDGKATASKTMRVRIPERNATTYTIAPSVSASMRERGPQDALASRRNNREMLKRLQRKTEKVGKM
ncbi:hypothetical protein M408DRAFT_326111 [Serendipita vermifera MAFF 305830]|uniref:TFIIS N-terminal domain-containing protein n=1 Tax=Serendipita vermifera MAFF 305830 TaxID=933852 RepID=A0A0C2XWY3_SERVB|nr:hypothetical protein M408DRAFT_326111 [Serendipita vermifera MAFF 305830]